MSCFKSKKKTNTKVVKERRTIYEPSDDVEAERITIEQVTRVESASGGDDYQVEYSKEIAETEQIQHFEQEQRQTILITGVINPETRKEIGLRTAIEEGIINQDNGTYNDPVSGQSVPIPVAINSGRIKVEMVQTDVGTERRKDLGLITISSHKETRPFRIEKVLDPKTEKTLSPEAAVKKGILDQERSLYIDKENSEELSFPEAIDSGRIIVSFAEQQISEEPEVVSKTYAIRSVVDHETRERVPFSVAVGMGLIDPETGSYSNKVTGETIHASEAISRGLIKATVVSDPKSAAAEVEKHEQQLANMKGIRAKILANTTAVAALQAQAASAQQQRVKRGKRFLYY